MCQLYNTVGATEALKILTLKDLRRNIMRLLKFASIFVLAAVACAPAFAQASPAVGTWKLNVEKSKYNPGQAPKSLTRTLEAQGDNVKYIFDGGSAAHSFTVAFDGKESPIAGSMAGGAVMPSQLNASMPTRLKPL